MTKLPQLQNYIDGIFQAAIISDQPLINPSDGSLLAHQVGSSEAALEQALAAADECHRSRRWSKLGTKRADYLLKVAAILEGQAEEYAWLESTNTGVILDQTRFLMKVLPFIFKAAAQQLIEHPDEEVLPGRGRIELLHRPWGPALCLAPWNSPGPIGAHKLASALAAGAPVILKPSEFTPFTTQKLFETLADCDFPRGAVQLVHGTQREGAQLVKDPRIKAISFTGGLRGGQAIAHACAETMRPLQLELGGHNPFIILPDADHEAMLDGVMAGLTTLNGQWCRAIGRIFVPEQRRDELLEGFRARLQNLRLGQATDPESQMGPLIHRQHRQHIQQKLLDLQMQGAVVHGPMTNDESCFFAPKLITDLPLRSDREEIFGPAAIVHSYRQVDDIAAMANDTSFGLAAYIYGSDLDRAWRLARELDTGSTKINGVSILSLSPVAPRAAWGISGLGVEGEYETFRFFQGPSVVGVLNSKPEDKA